MSKTQILGNPSLKRLSDFVPQQCSHRQNVLSPNGTMNCKICGCLITDKVQPYNCVYSSHFTDVSPSEILDNMLQCDDSPRVELEPEVMKKRKETIEFMTLVSKHREMRLSHLTLHVSVCYFDKYLDYIC